MAVGWAGRRLTRVGEEPASGRAGGPGPVLGRSLLKRREPSEKAAQFCRGGL